MHSAWLWDIWLGVGLETLVTSSFPGGCGEDDFLLCSLLFNLNSSLVGNQGGAEVEAFLTFPPLRLFLLGSPPISHVSTLAEGV